MNRREQKWKKKRSERNYNKAKLRVMQKVSIEMRKLMNDEEFMKKVAEEVSELKTPEDFKNYQLKAQELSKNEMQKM